jgi:hypothetical protein
MQPISVTSFEVGFPRLRAGQDDGRPRESCIAQEVRADGELSSPSSLKLETHAVPQGPEL